MTERKLTMEESALEMASDPESKAEAKLWEATLADGLEDEDFSGWPGYADAFAANVDSARRADGQ